MSRRIGRWSTADDDRLMRTASHWVAFLSLHFPELAASASATPEHHQADRHLRRTRLADHLWQHGPLLWTGRQNFEQYGDDRPQGFRCLPRRARKGRALATMSMSRTIVIPPKPNASQIHPFLFPSPSRRLGREPAISIGDIIHICIRQH